jgi:hypothetical protein
MSWFFGGGGGDKKPSQSEPLKIDDFDSSNFSTPTQTFDSSTNYAAPSAPLRSTGGGGGNFEQELMMEQQRIMVQAVMFKLTDLSFDTCVTKPSTSLSSSETSCISATVGKYLDASEIIVGRFQNAGK